MSVPHRDHRPASPATAGAGSPAGAAAAPLSRPPARTRAGWRAGAPGGRALARLLAGALVGLLVGLLPTGAAHAQPESRPDGSVVRTAHGPLGPADRDLLVRVRLAGLWEIPAGQLAAERGSDPRVREIGQFIADEHIALDEQVQQVAAELAVPLPDQPHPDHQVFLSRLDSRTGGEFDLEFIQRLREAHGQIYPLIAYVRAGTHNDLVREFAETSEEFVGRHMRYLESSGMVDWFHIPPPPEPAGSQSRFLGSEPAGVHPALVWALLGVAAAAGTVTVIRTVRPR